MIIKFHTRSGGQYTIDTVQKTFQKNGFDIQTYMDAHPMLDKNLMPIVGQSYLFRVHDGVVMTTKVTKVEL